MLIKILQFISDHLYTLGILLFLGVSLWNVLRKSQQQQIAKKILEKAVQTQADEPVSLHPEVDPAKCAGCGACTRVCPEGDIFKLINHKAVLVSPAKCVGHGECEVACPFGAIHLVFGTKTRGKEIPRLNSNYETNIPGLYICGELGGMGLIRNAVKQGALAAKHALRNLNRGAKADVDIFIVGAGPAGLSVSLSAIAGKATYKCIEQGSFGGTVYNFPRQKIVMSHPADLPIVGKMQFPGNRISKEQLLNYWTRIRKKTNLKISEQERFEGMEKRDGVFHITTSRGQYTARKLFLAMGVRGTPRRLGLPNEDLPKVTYNLLDPEQYKSRRLAVVGAGNAGVEAAQYLAKADLGNKVTLLVKGPTLDRCNEENQAAIESLRNKGLVEIWFNAEVKQIEPSFLMVNKAGTDVKLSNDFLFVFIGAEMPQKALMSLGIKIDKKFGEGLNTGRAS